MFGKSFTRSFALAAVIGGLAAGTASAHHSFASYDMSKTQTTAGTIKEFRWGAPHSSMVLTYTVKGKSADMSIISGSPLMFSRAGFAPRDFKRGDKVTVVYHPNVNGLPGGAMSKLILPDGRAYSDSEANNAAPPK
jgi:hypothetical protein